MGTFFAGVFRAPMTSIFMVFEVSASYVIILPVIVANTIAWFVSQQLQPVPFFTLLARREGVDLPSAEEYRTSRPLRVEDAMTPGPPPAVDAANTIREALAALERAGGEAVLVRKEARTWACVPRAALETAELPGATLGEALDLPPCPRIYPDMPADAALRLLGAYPLLPVASRTEPERLIGSVTLADVHRAYRL